MTKKTTTKNNKSSATTSELALEVESPVLGDDHVEVTVPTLAEELSLLFGWL